MKTVYTSLGFALGASAASLVARDQCCFGLTASGGVSGSVGQLIDGQNRIAQTGGLDQKNGQYCINDGKITDGKGRGCILTPPTTQFQCDEGASPTGGFSVSDGNVQYNGSGKFYACPTGDNGGYNIYTTPVENQQGCVDITLSTGGQCSGNGAGSSSAPASSAPAASQPASSAPAPSAPASSAPASSAPAPSAPASSAPASSAPASSAPAASQPASSAPAPSAPAPSAPASSAPAPSAPAPSASAASQPASSASAPSAPASSAPAPSAPAASQPASSAPEASAPHPTTKTLFSTHYETITSCGPSVTNCPAESTVVKSTVLSSSPAASAPASSAPASSAPAPAPSAPASSAPASSAPAPSAPASSAPASSAPASSAPTSSAPASSAPAPSVPASSAPASSAPASSVPASSAPATSAPAPSASVTSPSSASGSGSACATTLGSTYETPHAIIPVNKNEPSTSYGTQYFAYLGGGNNTIFNFDIPSSYTSKQCSLIFLFPEQKDLETSSFTESGSGGLTFTQLSEVAGLDVSYESAPKSKQTIGSVDGVKPGNSYVVASGPCDAGSTQSIEVAATGGYQLSFFEDWNPSPIGLFVTVC